LFFLFIFAQPWHWAIYYIIDIGCKWFITVWLVVGSNVIIYIKSISRSSKAQIKTTRREKGGFWGGWRGGGGLRGERKEKKKKEEENAKRLVPILGLEPRSPG